MCNYVLLPVINNYDLCSSHFHFHFSNWAAVSVVYSFAVLLPSECKLDDFDPPHSVKYICLFFLLCDTLSILQPLQLKYLPNILKVIT
jgi:hypothetical protein